MPSYVAHIKKWKDRAKIDFFTEFVKAWIPFNAWYNQSYTEAKNDREILNEIKNNSCVKTKLKRLLENDDTDANNFKNKLENFHEILENLQLKNNSFDVNFTNVVIERNNKKESKKNSRGIEYCAIYSNNKYCATVTTSYGEKTLNYSHTEYDIAHFEENVRNSGISDTQIGYIRSCFKDINPYIPQNLITTDESNCLRVGKFKFVNNSDLISKAIIENIYSLRCMLFHGSIEPREDTEKLYENAYYILKAFLEAIE